ncbi:MAG: site-2 protease family protein [Oscillospiraceae bacterium]|nr:site-2 protease family protein [Oscillospiraceae bacterium]
MSITFLSILFAVLVFGVIIIVHELGHFLTARKFGIRVDEFAIGMGPAIFKRQGEQTLFTLRLLPIGGFCALGEDEERESEDSFRKKPVPPRIAVMAAGAVLNILLGFVIVLFATAHSREAVIAKIIWIAEDALCREYGLQVDDTILKINNRRIFTIGDLSYQLSNAENGVADMVVERGGEKIALNGVRFDMETDPETGRQVLRYNFRVTRLENINAAQVFIYSFKETAYYARIVIMSLGDIIQGKYGINDLQGPVGIVTIISDVAESQGFNSKILIDIAALITINIGMFNLLPIPALDGGRIVFLLIEGIRGKQLKAETEGTIHFIGFALLILLMIVVTFNDIGKIVGG